MFGLRLRKQLEDEGLSPSHFADEIGVNRSAISHVLNNRNKPGYDFILKIKKGFPEWDLDWLLFGEKKSSPIKDRTHVQKIDSPTREKQLDFTQKSLFEENQDQFSEKSLSTTRLKRQVTKTILIYSDGTFEIFQNNFN